MIHGGILNHDVICSTLNPHEVSAHHQHNNLCGSGSSGGGGSGGSGGGGGGGGIYRDPIDSVQSRQLPEIPADGRHLEETCSGRFWD